MFFCVCHGDFSVVSIFVAKKSQSQKLKVYHYQQSIQRLLIKLAIQMLLIQFQDKLTADGIYINCNDKGKRKNWVQ